MTPIDDTDPLDSTTSSFVAVFAAVWARGDGPDEFCGSPLADWVDPDVTFTQPLAPAAHGHEGFQRFTRSAFAVVPDLRCGITDRHPTTDGVVLDPHFSGTVTGRHVEWVGQDTIVLRNGKLVHRTADFSVFPLLRVVVTSVADLIRGGVPAGVAWRSTLLTEAFAAIGAAAVVSDRTTTSTVNR